MLELEFCFVKEVPHKATVWGVEVETTKQIWKHKITGKEVTRFWNYNVKREKTSLETSRLSKYLKSLTEKDGNAYHHARYILVK